MVLSRKRKQGKARKGKATKAAKAAAAAAEDEAVVTHELAQRSISAEIESKKGWYLTICRHYALYYEVESVVIDFLNAFLDNFGLDIDRHDMVMSIALMHSMQHIKP